MAERNIKNKREQYSKDLQAKKDELQKQVKDIALNFTRSPEQLAELAAFQSKFYSYSFRNTLLIYSQNRGASFVGSFVKFKELGKEIAVKNNELDEKGNVPYWGVKSGAKGMKINAQYEIEADIYSIMLSSHFGIETNDVRKGHLADSFKAYKESISLSDRKKDFDTLETIFSNADKVFKETIGDIDRYVKQYIQKEKSFAEQVDDVLEGKADNYNNLKVCNTPQILLDVGCEQLPMLYTQRHLKDALKNKDKSNSHFHGLTVEQIKQLPDLIKEPAIVFDSISPSNKGIVLALNATDNDNAPLIVSVYPNGKGIYQLEKIDSNFITSIYGKDNGFENYITRAANTNSILFWDKKRSQELFSCQGLQLPEAINNLDSNIIIHQSRNIVNSKNEKISLENIGKTVDEKLLSSKVAPKCYNITGAVEELIKEYSAEKIKDCAAVSILCRQKEITDGSLVDWAKEHISKNNIDTPNLTFKKSPCKCNIKFLNAFAEKLEVSPQQNSRKVLHGEPVNVKDRTIKL